MSKKKFLIILSMMILLISAVTIASDLIIESKTQTYSEQDSLIKFLGDVKVRYKDITIVGDTADVSVTKDNKLDTATFYEKPYAFQVQNNKKKEVKANIMRFSLLNKVIKAEGDTQTIVTEGKTPIAIINADAQEYDTTTNVMTALGTVTIKYRDMDAFSDKAIVKTSKNGEVQRIDLIGNAKINQTKHHAAADHFIYTASKEEIIAIGNTTSSTVTENGSTFKIKANRQQYDKKSNIFTGNGNVQVYYQDYYAKSPKMVCYPDKVTKKINEVYMHGRSMIRQNEKEVHADKIKILIEPKNFEAIGNVRTIFKNIDSNQNKDKNGGLL